MFLMKRSQVRLITSKRKQTGGTTKRQGSWLLTSEVLSTDHAFEIFCLKFQMEFLSTVY